MKLFTILNSSLNIFLKIPITIKKIVLSIYCYNTIKLYSCNHLKINIWELYKKRVKFPHPVGIVIGENVKIGSDCTIFQNVTIGTKDNEGYLLSKYPKIEKNVTIYANSVIIGNVTIGESAIIGAGSIVLEDVPPFSIAAGNPARVIKQM